MPALTGGASARDAGAGAAPPRRRVVLGIGNLLNRDEGAGIHALRALGEALADDPIDPEVELLDGGVLGLDLLPLIEDCSHLLILDAIDAGRPAGTVVELDGRDLDLFRGIRLSQHQITFVDVLALASLRERLPGWLRIVGVQPGDLELGLELSPGVSRAIPSVVSRARTQLFLWKGVS